MASVCALRPELLTAIRVRLRRNAYIVDIHLEEVALAPLGAGVPGVAVPGLVRGPPFPIG